MNLFETFGEIFHPKDKLSELKFESYYMWAQFKKLTNPDSEEFFTLMSNISEKLVSLSDYGHYPDWMDAYDKHCLLYFDRFKFVTKIKKAKEVKAKDFNYCSN